MEVAGCGAIVLHSLFEEQVRAEAAAMDQVISMPQDSYPEAMSYLPELPDFEMNENGYFDYIRRAKRRLNIPLVASLNASTAGGWARIARNIEAAGADALELNTYDITADPDVTGADVEERVVSVVKEVSDTVMLPIAVKLSPFFASPANLAKRLSGAGASAITIFNRFYQPEPDLDELSIMPNLRLSTPEELRLRLRWAGLLYGRVPVQMAVTGGVHSGRDIAKCILCGANTAMMTSALLMNGIDYVRTALDELQEWMEEQGYTSVDEMRGAMSQQHVENPSRYERANYIHVLSSYVPVRV
jgi:dihydroorotate dehydrogenase (fumarate)